MNLSEPVTQENSEKRVFRSINLLILNVVRFNCAKMKCDLQLVVPKFHAELLLTLMAYVILTHAL